MIARVLLHIGYMIIVIALRVYSDAGLCIDGDNYIEWLRVGISEEKYYLIKSASVISYMIYETALSDKLIIIDITSRRLRLFGCSHWRSFKVPS